MSTLRYATSLAEKVGGKVIALNVVQNPVVYPVFTAEDQEAFVNEAQNKLYQACQAESAKAQDVETMIRVGVESVAEEIALAAHDVAADLIVVAAHESGGFGPTLFANTADRIARHAPCPVLMVPVPAAAPGKLEDYSS